VNARPLTLVPLCICLGLTACHSIPSPDTQHHQMNATVHESPPNEFYEVHHDNGRIYLFADRATYLSFLEVGETPYIVAEIGAGPEGQTLVFGLPVAEKEQGTEAQVVKRYNEKLAFSKEDFYGELITENRHYVFNDWEAMKAVREMGEPAYFFAEIGGGPGGKSVFYVLTQEQKDQRPDVLIAQFKQIHQLSN